MQKQVKPKARPARKSQYKKGVSGVSRKSKGIVRHEMTRFINRKIERQMAARAVRYEEKIGLIKVD
jgi:hypothetical protein